MDTLRVFIEWCETIDAVQYGLFKKIKSPVIPDGGYVRETTLTTDRANENLDYLEKYEYTTVEHVTWLVLAETGMRMGGAHGLDVDDYRREEEHPHLQLLDRPDTDTPLKNGRKGERPVSISSNACDLIDDYLENRRPGVTDGYGRDPLLASPRGRISKSTIRKYVYKWSRPCAVGAACPHDGDPGECDAAIDLDQVSSAPQALHRISSVGATFLGSARRVSPLRSSVTAGTSHQWLSTSITTSDPRTRRCSSAKKSFVRRYNGPAIDGGGFGSRKAWTLIKYRCRNQGR